MMIDKLKGKTIKSIDVREYYVDIVFEDETELTISIDCYDFDRYRLELEIN
jgi:hypothetical protein